MVSCEDGLSEFFSAILMKIVTGTAEPFTPVAFTISFSGVAIVFEEETEMEKNAMHCDV